MSKRDKYILTAFVVCTFVQLWLLSRIIHMQQHLHEVRDFSPRDSWYIFNLILAGIVLVVMATVLRVGRWWQRFVALVVCICPVIFIYDVCRWSSAH